MVISLLVPPLIWYQPWWVGRSVVFFHGVLVSASLSAQFAFSFVRCSVPHPAQRTSNPSAYSTMVLHPSDGVLYGFPHSLHISSNCLYRHLLITKEQLIWIWGAAPDLVSPLPWPWRASRSAGPKQPPWLVTSRLFVCYDKKKPPNNGWLAANMVTKRLFGCYDTKASNKWLVSTAKAATISAFLGIGSEKLYPLLWAWKRPKPIQSEIRL